MQPLAREMAKQRFLNDKYKSALIRINPVKERQAQYNWEREQYELIEGQFGHLQMRNKILEKQIEELEYLKSQL